MDGNGVPSLDVGPMKSYNCKQDYVKLPKVIFCCGRTLYEVSFDKEPIESSDWKPGEIELAVIN